MRERRLFYCYKCGGKLTEADNRLKCIECNTISYENPIVGVAGMLFDKTGRVLLVRRAPGVDYAGLWCLPCGYVEYDEDIRVAVSREVKEETGFVVKPVKVFAVYSNFHNPRQHTVGVWFLCDIISGELKAGDDADQADWFRPDKSPALAFPTDKLVLDEWQGKLNKEAKQP